MSTCEPTDGLFLARSHPAVTFQSDGRCSPRSSEPAANQGHRSSASPPPPDKQRQCQTTISSMSSGPPVPPRTLTKSNHFWLTSVCEIPTASPVLNARFRFSFCGDEHKSTVSQSKQICLSVCCNEIPCSRVTGCCRGCARGGRCDRQRRRRDRRPSCC